MISIHTLSISINLSICAINLCTCVCIRGDISRLQRCTQITTHLKDQLPRSKPFKFTYEKEIVLYAYHKKLDYFSTECTYSPNGNLSVSRIIIQLFNYPMYKHSIVYFNYSINNISLPLFYSLPFVFGVPS